MKPIDLRLTLLKNLGENIEGHLLSVIEDRPEEKRLREAHKGLSMFLSNVDSTLLSESPSQGNRINKEE